MASKNPLLKKIANSSASKGGNNIKDGKYRFTIAKILLEKKNDGDMFIVEFRVDKSEDMPGTWEKGGKAVWECEGCTPVRANPVGSRVSYVLNLSSNKSAPGNVKAFVLALLGTEESDTSDDEVEETLEELIGKAQPGRGMAIEDETYRKEIKSGKNAGLPFVGHNWTHVALTEAEIAAARAELDKADKDAEDKKDTKAA